MRIAVLAPGSLVALLVLLLLSGCGDEPGGAGAGATNDPTASPTRSCPAYAEVTGPTGEAANDRFILGLEPGSELADDPAARATVLAEVGERLCLELSDLDLLSDGAVLVGTDRLLDAKGQSVLTTALERVDDVAYAVPDGIATTNADPDLEPDVEPAQ